MHDPLSVAFDIPNPLAARWEHGQGRTTWWQRFKCRPSLVTIWHKDPERDGSDDSCDWFGSKRKLNEKETALSRAAAEVDRLVGFPPHFEYRRTEIARNRLEEFTHTECWGSDLFLAVRELNRARFAWYQRPRFRLPVRWHVWHWRIQVHPWQQLRRVLFDRCHFCGGRFTGSESVSGSWDGDAIWHSRCTPQPPTPKP